MDIIIKLPEDIQRYVYEFDPTYKIKYSYCMVSISMMSNELLRKNKIYSVIQPTKNTFYFSKAAMFSFNFLTSFLSLQTS